MSDDKLLSYFMSQTNERLESMEKKIDKLIGFRWMQIGGATIISALVALAVAILYGR